LDAIIGIKTIARKADYNSEKFVCSKVGKIYKVSKCHQYGTYKVLSVKMRKRTGDVWVTFIGISGDMLPDRQTFLIGSVFDQCSEWAV
jgi:hypothetical protein